MPLEPGRAAPSFELRDQNGHKHALGDYAGRQVVLFFFPRAGSVECTNEACQFRDRRPEFDRVKASIIGISPDDQAALRRFASEHDLTFTLLSDAERDRRGRSPTCREFGTWVEKVVYGRKVMGVARTTYLIDARGRILRRWDRVKVAGHAEDVLQTIGVIRAAEKGGAVEPKSLAAKLRRRRKGRTHDSDPPFTPSRGSRAPGLKRVRVGGRQAG